MKPNVGKADKVIRYSLGIIIIVGGIFYQSWWGALGLVPILTATISWCPIYAPYRISTIEKKTQTNN